MPPGLRDRVANWGLAVDKHFLAVIDDDALPFIRFATALGFDGEDALGSDQQVVDVEGCVAGFNRDIVDNLVTLGAELFEILAYGLFGFDAAINEPDLFDDAFIFPERESCKNSGRNCEGRAICFHPAQLNGPHIGA